ncbi:class I SAM-dependent methyltransferase [Parapedobacter tibetensis]|uniref:class I SAM-dependent methyltransferase n=1 Tax=Parapedobacter tibetensis TaxID=2972951 RepID=UPI00214DA983|nr:class I SAM-dependent methyltransferase [Parapedobacter tibetensis]
MRTIESQLVQPIEFLQKIVSKGGPEPHEYDQLTRIADKLGREYKAGNIADIDLKLMQNSFGEECLQATLHGHSITKPYGYAGDFMIIDKIYRKYTTSDKRFEKWDRFWQSSAATQAVRNRKTYFIKTITNRLEGKEKLNLLNVASGPARDLTDLYARIGKGRVSTLCIEADSRAIAYANELNKAYSEEINFMEKNIFRYEADRMFDIVWSAGLFDYFNDSVFVKIVRRFVSWTNPGGEVIIGNFSTHNPTRAFMELFGDWYLHHRSEEHLIKLAMQAGLRKENIKVEREPEGVNLFLHILV